MLKAAIKYVVELCFNLNMFIKKDSKKRKIFLLLTPQYLNYGDHAIAEAEKKYLSEHFTQYEIEEINYSFWEYWSDNAKKRVKKEDIVLITGGGYAGDLWPDNQKLMEEVIEAFPMNKVILAPQTVFFKNLERSRSYESLKKIINEHRRIYIIAREKNTYRLLKEQFKMAPGENLFLLADFVLTLNLANDTGKRKGIAFCLRKDNERMLSDLQIDEVMHQLSISKADVQFIQMAMDHVEIPIWLRRRFLKRKFSEFKTKQLVVTDRLHGMIFAAVTGTPCIALDNISHKISGTYEKLCTLSYIKIAKDPKEISELANEVLVITEEQRQKELNTLHQKLYNEYETVFYQLLTDTTEV